MDFVILAAYESSKIASDLEVKIRTVVPSSSVQVQGYDDPFPKKVGLVIAEEFIPVPEYYDLVRVLVSEGREVSLFSEYFGNSIDDIRMLKAKGYIFRLEGKDFEVLDPYFFGRFTNVESFLGRFLEPKISS